LSAGFGLAGLIVIASVDVSSKPIGEFNSSLAVYVIHGFLHRPEPDLRGKTWEREFNLTSNISVYQIVNGPLMGDGINFTFLPEGANLPYLDDRPRRLTEQSWRHFLKYHTDTHWYMRGMYDMYLNLTNMKDFIANLEARYDPMTDFVGRYGCSHWKRDFPHGSTGFLFSNAAVRLLFGSLAEFQNCKGNDDLCMRNMYDLLHMSFHEGCSSRFIVTFPRNISKLSKPIKCPRHQSYGRRSLIRVPPALVKAAVTIHMHGIPMHFWTNWVKMAADSSIAWVRNGTENVPVFCKSWWKRLFNR
jgi:hypothetical protein